jgi:hypothetical protein
LKTNSEDLGKILQQIEVNLKKLGFTIFYGADTAKEELNFNEIRWDIDRSDWKGFLDIAKESEAKVVVLETTTFREEDFLERAQDITEDREGVELIEVPKELKKYLGKIGKFSLYWLRDGVKYAYSHSADWWEDMQAILSDLTEEEEIPKELKDKSVKELGNELVEFINGFPEATFTRSLVGLFWQSKGLKDTSFIDDIQFEIKKKKVESFAELKIEKENQKREKSTIPKLFEECVKWARENGMRKVTKTNVDYFLCDKEVTLSKTSRDTIYNKTNLILSK